MKLSIVATLYKSANYISEFHQRISKIAKELSDEDYEIILVDDGSPDNSLEIAVESSKLDHHLVVVELSRNFGHHKAMMTGLEQARGDRIFLIDSDLEEEPELLTVFSKHMDHTACDVVFGVQESRKGKWFERKSGQWFYGLLNKLTNLNLPENVVTARLMTKDYVQALVQHKEREVFMAGLWHITGFDQRPYTIKKHSKGDTTYTLRKKLSLLVNSVTSFSNAPLVGIFYIGLSIFFLTMIYIAYLVINWLCFSRPLSGWTSVMASIWLLGGMLISFIGILGIYLSKIYSETKQRPYTIVRKIHEK
jgi:putative glycosyltransferase